MVEEKDGLSGQMKSLKEQLQQSQKDNEEIRDAEESRKRLLCTPAGTGGVNSNSNSDTPSSPPLCLSLESTATMVEVSIEIKCDIKGRPRRRRV